MASPADRSSRMSWKRSDASRWIDDGFVWLTAAFALGIGILLLTIAGRVGTDAFPAIQKFGFGFLTTSRWSVNDEVFGALTQIYGTLITSFLALLLAVPVGIGVALFLSEDFLPPRVKQPIVFMVELLAAIPSVVYGLWGIFVLIPVLRPFGIWLNAAFGWIPIFSTAPAGPGIYAAGIILAIMILPIIAAISRDALVAVPSELRQAAYGLGATRWETIFRVLLPAAFSGIVGGIMLALGRAMGETMAVTMVIGNVDSIRTFSILSQGSTVASLLANQFAEASGLQVASLMYAALILFILTLIVNVLAEWIVRRFSMKL
ncbi:MULTISPECIES: phosphate ABC transporter permease subunit PstC [Leptolyngbya]|jgi:phosphate transport system permease protein|uniref:Phosphate transport system permease protein n=1 Tax=Leptolyngbya boryana NIES-2135 TaxID=1973484 RepID=A0A1Z4JLZ0_LEPBY|nr:MULTISPECIES: phosphate ABC transporter permease subunit PstC [Leptolyngbya]BAY57716.1 phosphate ABC transporter permease [Leptolyngbya boryana NIES-2135]MBD2367668.1 phosphate ABC transporter permease subunit PstC [Leptolyngbya sp. FACHB-161]MBD2374192.1 phosphate ABC transporter permease subunit PstC [Leptolyngbya sp. FACHB-238]MBD2398817.1 phosphate ABC transporter permease subunit PstC [Leptolyngbya sp. FACHB-239]MBD2405041.1 phosphate ABC transporter permease subunit PstC [Leptolyngbya